DDVQHLFQRQRLEIESVAEREVGAHGLRVVIDDDSLDARRLQFLHRVHRRIVELDPLPDAYRPTPQHDHLGPRKRFGLILLLVDAYQPRDEPGVDAADAAYFLHTPIPRNRVVNRAWPLVRGVHQALGNPLSRPGVAHLQPRRAQIEAPQRLQERLLERPAY